MVSQGAGMCDSSLQTQDVARPTTTPSRAKLRADLEGDSNAKA